MTLNAHRAKPRVCRACHSAPAIRRGLSLRLCGNCLAKPALQREKPVRPPLPAYKLLRVAQEGVSKPCLDIGKGMYRSQALRQSARDETCVACGAKDGTVVWCHANEYELGKAKSMKCHDLLGNYFCMRCHSAYDSGPGTREEKRAFFRENYPRTMVRVAEKLAAGELRL